MDEVKLKALYGSGNVARAFFDHMAGRQRNQSETKVDRILVNLADAGLSRGDIIELFRELEDAGCGQFVMGRRGWPSRFVWTVGSLDASQLAIGELRNQQEVATDTAVEAGEVDDLLVHTFKLRPDLTVEFQLPTDLSAKEAERLALFVRSLPMEEFE